MNREEAYNLLKEYTQKESLFKHSLAIEAAMIAYAKKCGEDEESWGIVGLLHDFDYDKYPEEHPYKAAEILKEKNVPADWINAILGHGNYTGVKRESKLAKVLFAVDELTGLITAATFVRPSKKIADLEVKSVKKRMKEKSFSAAINREDIITGAKDFGVNLDEHIGVVLKAMQRIADKLGL